MDSLGKWLKQKWLLVLILAIIAMLLSIPAKTGLPDKSYSGCEIQGSQCYSGVIKSASKGEDGSMLIEVPIVIEGGQAETLPLRLKNNHGRIVAGSKIFMNFVRDEYVVLFIEKDTRFLWNAIFFVLEAKQGSTATVNLQTLEEH